MFRRVVGSRVLSGASTPPSPLQESAPFYDPVSVATARVRFAEATTGRSISFTRRARFSQGAGVGVFLAAAFISLQLDAARDLDGGARLHVGTTATFLTATPGVPCARLSPVRRRWPAGDTMTPMLAAQPQVGYSDLLSMPDDGRRYEIHGGELVVVPAPRLRHQVVALEIFKRLDAYAARRGGRAVAAPFDIVFDEHDVVQPDVVFFRAERVRLLDPDAVTRAAPDIAVEVLSPSTATLDRGRKMRLFARYGVPECWIADPLRRSVEVHVLDPETRAYRRALTAGDEDTVRSVLLPDLTVEASGIFPLP